MTNKLESDPDKAQIFGVCAGFSNYFNISVVVMRLIFLVGTFFISSGFLLLYLLLAIAIPEQEYKED